MCKKNTDKLRINWLFIYVYAETREAIIHFGIFKRIKNICLFHISMLFCLLSYNTENSIVCRDAFL